MDIDWGLATQIFIVGVFVVMFVMFILQVSVGVTSTVVRSLEKNIAKSKG